MQNYLESNFRLEECKRTKLYGYIEFPDVAYRLFFFDRKKGYTILHNKLNQDRGKYAVVHKSGKCTPYDWQVFRSKVMEVHNFYLDRNLIDI